MKNKKKSMPKEEKKVINAVLRKYQRDRDNLIPILQGIQRKNGYISKEAVNGISGYLDISENEIYGVATFYTQFRFQRPGDHIVKVCQGTACHVRDSERIKDEVSRYLGINTGETTPDYRFSLEGVACFGSCALSPVVVVDDKVYGRMTPQKVKEILGKFRKK
jgi:NADH:ubiquinone oxidoreductase subunit E